MIFYSQCIQSQKDKCFMTIGLHILFNKLYNLPILNAHVDDHEDCTIIVHVIIQ